MSAEPYSLFFAKLFLLVLDFISIHEFQPLVTKIDWAKNRRVSFWQNEWHLILNFDSFCELNDTEDIHCPEKEVPVL